MASLKSAGRGRGDLGVAVVTPGPNFLVAARWIDPAAAAVFAAFGVALIARRA